MVIKDDILSKCLFFDFENNPEHKKLLGLKIELIRENMIEDGEIVMKSTTWVYNKCIKDDLSKEDEIIKLLLDWIDT